MDVDVAARRAARKARNREKNKQKAALAMPEAGAKRRRLTDGPLHVRDTPVAPTGLGAAAAGAAVRKEAKSTNKWDFFSAASPKGLPPPSMRAVPRSAAAAAAVEVQRWRALERLRRKLHDLCSEAGLEAPPQLSFERWRFGCKQQACEVLIIIIIIK